MKTLPTALAAHVATRDTTLATALKITRSDGEVFAFTTHDVDDPVDGVTYLSNPGLDVTDIVIAADAAVGNLELTTLHDGTVFTTADILGGAWRNAAFILFRYNWASLAAGVDTLLAGTFGEVTLKQNQVVAELRDLRQYLQQSVGSASSKTCRYRLGSTDKNAGGLCMKDLTAFTVTGTLTGVTSNQVFRDSARTENLAWFDEGQITFTGGANSGLSAKVKAYAADGTFTLALPLYGTVAIGDTYSAVAGCRKRLDEDCVAKFDNALNFGGEPHRKGLNDLTKAVVPNV
ncbi:MAG: DUF2163 domain-containing protein [Betaproteobacteria bacterium]|nr:DUF2163 domain-containing protein [Betaproteobacteria bacterium]